MLLRRPWLYSRTKAYQTKAPQQKPPACPSPFSDSAGIQTCVHLRHVCRAGAVARRCMPEPPSFAKSQTQSRKLSVTCSRQHGSVPQVAHMEHQFIKLTHLPPAHGCHHEGFLSYGVFNATTASFSQCGCQVKSVNACRPYRGNGGDARACGLLRALRKRGVSLAECIPTALQVLYLLYGPAFQHPPGSSRGRSGNTCWGNTWQQACQACAEGITCSARRAGYNNASVRLLGFLYLSLGTRKKHNRMLHEKRKVAHMHTFS